MYSKKYRSYCYFKVYLLSDGTSVVEKNLFGVKPELQHVVTQGEEGGEGEGADEDRDESILNDLHHSSNNKLYFNQITDHLKVFIEESLLSPLHQLQVLHELRRLAVPVVFALLPAKLEQVDQLPEKRHVVLHHREKELLPHKDNGQLDAELDKAAARRAFLLPPAKPPEGPSIKINRSVLKLWLLSFLWAGSCQHLQ